MADGEKDKQIAMFCTVATAVKFYGVLAKSRHIYSHIAFGICPSSSVSKMQIIQENKDNVPESGTLSALRLSRWKDDRSDGPVA
jgi:hypothetical protein